MDLLVNEDGSVDLYFGPEAPADKEQNWIPTVPDKAWFPYFRLYSPTQAFLDKTWVLPDKFGYNAINWMATISIGLSALLVFISLWPTERKIRAEESAAAAPIA